MAAGTAHDPNDLPRRLGRYELVRPLGAGGTGRVVEAILHGPRGFRKRVALKLLHGGPGDTLSVARLVREARFGAMLSHPNVVPTLELGEIDGIWFVSMELVNGPTLAELLRAGPLGAPAVVDVGLQVCAALTHLHAGLVHGDDDSGTPPRLVHRDVKPSNLLVDPSGLVRLADFGIAAFAAEVSGRMSGSPGFMAPEQMAGHGEPRSDLFGLGMTLLTLAVGRNPLGRGVTALHAAHAIEERLARPSFLEPADRLLPGLGEVLRGCLRRAPADRWPDAASLGRALRALRIDARGPSLALLARSGTAPSTDADITLPITTFGMLLAPPDPLVGRTAELQAVLAAVGTDRRRLVTLVGPPGVGKTRLAIEVATRSRPGREALFCELASARNASELARAVAVTLGVESTQQDAVDAAGRALAGRGAALVILDNLEQVGPGAVEVIRRWLACAPEITILVTSRAPLRTAPEEVIELAPLDPESAVTLFAVRRGRPVDTAERAAVEALLTRVDHLPLTIELIAARGRLLSADALVARLGDGFELLAGDPRNADARHRTARAAIAWSWELLGPAEQTALAQLSVLEGRFDLEAAEAVLDLSATPSTRWTLDVLASLVDHSLLQVHGQQFAMLTLVRTFARDQLVESGAAEAAERRHGEHFATFGAEASRIALRRPGAAARLRALCDLLPDLLAAARRAVARRDEAVAVPATLAAIEAILLRGPTADGVALADAALELAEQPLNRGLLLEYAGELLGIVGAVSRARSRLSEAIERYTEVGDLGLVARARARVGKIERQYGSAEQARATLELALSEARTAGHRGPEAAALNELSMLALACGRRAEGRDLVTAALEVCRAAGDARGEGACLGNLGLAQRELGESDAARASLNASLDALRDVGDVRSRGQVLSNLGVLDLNDRHLVTARLHSLRALETHRRTGARREEALALATLGIVHRELGEPAEARRWLEQALSMTEAIGDHRGAAVTLSNLAQVDVDEGRFDEARRRFGAALAGSRAAANVFSEAVALARRGRLEIEAGNLDLAAVDLTAALEIAVRHGFRSLEHTVALWLARRARLAGEPALAQTHLARAEQAVTVDDRCGAWVERGLQHPAEAARCLAEAEAALGGTPWPVDLVADLALLRDAARERPGGGPLPEHRRPQRRP